MTPEITTEELVAILAAKERTGLRRANAQRSTRLRTSPARSTSSSWKLQRISGLYPDRATRMILYCNGPSCGKSKRTSEQLVALGYTHVRRYQLGMSVWRALSHTVQTDLPGFDYIYKGDHTAVFVDARTPAEYARGTVAGAVNIQKGEAAAANDDGRLPLTDKGTRIVVFGQTDEQSKVVATEIAEKAYWNSSYFGGTFDDLAAGHYVRSTAGSQRWSRAVDRACPASAGFRMACPRLCRSVPTIGRVPGRCSSMR